jgi:hypothetical protein
MKEDGTIDLEASAAKLSDGYDHLAKRLGGDDVPPKTAEEYAPDVPEGIDMEALKADPLYQDFLKSAHARGMSNKNVSWLLDEFAKRQGGQAEPAAMDVDTLRAELAPVWGDDPKAFDKGINDGLRAIKAYMPGISQEQLASIPNSPIVMQLLAAIGKEVGEDKRIQAAPVDAKSFEDELTALKAHPAFNDPRHVEHKQIMQKKSELFARRYAK